MNRKVMMAQIIYLQGCVLILNSKEKYKYKYNCLTLFYIIYMLFFGQVIVISTA